MKLNTPHLRILFLCTMAFVAAVWAQRDENAIVINVTQAQSPETFLNGYRAAINGQTLTYPLSASRRGSRTDRASASRNFHHCVGI
jgi:hypothetical protein